MTTSRGVSRLVYIDSVRGIASLAVAVFFHYRHFSSLFQPGGAPPRSAPFYTLLRPLYNYGYLAVDVFFILSGFIFCHVYAESIRSRRVTAWKFFVHRFSRLYPLHFATLCVTGVLVYAFRHQTGRFPVYQYNGLQDFVLNVLFLQSGVLDRGMSFNGPSWSLSIEALLYFCFFVWACRSGRLRWIAAILLAAVAMLLSGRTHEWRPLLMSPRLAEGLIGFFLGVLVYRYGRTRPIVVAAAIALPALACAISPTRVPVEWCGCWVVFTPLLLALYRWRPLQRPLEWKPFIFLGDLSLAMYLLHFPLQVFIMVMLNALHKPIPYQSGAFLTAYAAALIALSAAVYYGFEMPVQARLRSALLNQK